MRYYIALGFAITDLVLYYNAYLQHDRGVLPALTVLWWVSLGLLAIFIVIDLLNAKVFQVIFSVLGTIGSAYVFFAGVLNFQQWALALSFWIAFGILCLYALAGAGAMLESDD